MYGMTFEELEKQTKELRRKLEVLKNELNVSQARRIPKRFTGGVDISKPHRNPLTIMKEITDTQKKLEELYKLSLVIAKPIEAGTIALQYSGQDEQGKFCYKDGRGDKSIIVLKGLTSNGSWYNDRDMYNVGQRTEVDVNSKHIPIKLRIFKQSSDTEGKLLCYKYNVKVDYVPKIDFKPIPVLEPPKRTDKVTEGKASMLGEAWICKCGVVLSAICLLCPKCGEDKPKKTYDVRDTKTPKDFKCPKCGKWSKVFNMLKPFRCVLCGSEFKSIEDTKVSEEKKKGTLEKLKGYAKKIAKEKKQHNEAQKRNKSWIP